MFDICSPWGEPGDRDSFPCGSGEDGHKEMKGGGKGGHGRPWGSQTPGMRPSRYGRAGTHSSEVSPANP